MDIISYKSYGFKDLVKEAVKKYFLNLVQTNFQSEIISFILGLVRIRKFKLTINGLKNFLMRYPPIIFTQTIENFNCGFVIGKYYFGYICPGDIACMIRDSPYRNEIGNSYIYTTLSTFQNFNFDDEIVCGSNSLSSLIQHQESQPEINTNINKIIYYKKSKDHPYYKNANIYISSNTINTPNDYQKNILHKIQEIYAIKNKCFALLSGTKGIGKTFIGLLLAINIKGGIVIDYDPTRLTIGINDLIDSHNKNNPDMPLVIMIEEVDIMIDKILLNEDQSKTINSNIYYPDISNKADWNKHFDMLQSIFYKNIIIIMTTNKPLSYFPSEFIREGRVDLCDEHFL